MRLLYGATAILGTPFFDHFEIVGYLGDTHLLAYSVLRIHQIDIRGTLRRKAYRSSSPEERPRQRRWFVRDVSERSTERRLASIPRRRLLVGMSQCENARFSQTRAADLQADG